MIINFEKFQEIEKDTMKILDRKKIVDTLSLAGLYLAVFETLKHSIEYSIKSFFSSPQETLSQEYENYKKEIEEFYPKNKDGKIINDKLFACMKWSKKMQIISSQDMSTIIKIRKHRNDVAHQLPKILLNDQIDINIDLMVKALELINKIEKWWAVNVDLPIVGDNYTENEDEIYPPNVLIINHTVKSLINFLFPSSENES